MPVIVQENAATVYATQLCGYIHAFTAVVALKGTSAKDFEGFSWCCG